MREASEGWSPATAAAAAIHLETNVLKLSGCVLVL